jgi:hypothetical protein
LDTQSRTRDICPDTTNKRDGIKEIHNTAQNRSEVGNDL